MASDNLQHERARGDTRLALVTCVVTGILLTVLRATEGPLSHEERVALGLFPPALYIAARAFVIAGAMCASCLGRRERRSVRGEGGSQQVPGRRVTSLVSSCVGLLAVMADAMSQREVVIAFGCAVLGGLIALSSRRQVPVGDASATNRTTGVPVQLAVEQVVPSESGPAVVQQSVVTPARRSVPDATGANVIPFPPRPGGPVRWSLIDRQYLAHLRRQGKWSQVVRFGPVKMRRDLMKELAQMFAAEREAERAAARREGDGSRDGEG